MLPNLSISRIWSIGMLFLLLLAFELPVVDALTQSLCSSFNTGAGSQVVTNNYQSNGECFDTCKANYAFAVVQGKNCWCSDYAPADTASVSSSCNTPCPGYPFEQCGSGQYFGYIKLNKAAVGTLGASQRQSSTSSPAEVATSNSQVVSSPTPPRLTSRSFSVSTEASSSTSAIAENQLSSMISFRPLTFSEPPFFTTSISSKFTILTPSVQTPPAPKSVTVQETVTASPSTPSTILGTITETTTTATPAQPSTQYVSIPVTETTFSTTRPPPLPTTSATTSSPDPTSSSSEDGSSARSTWTPTPITSVMTVTGQVKTITITPTVPPTGAVAAQSSPDGGFMTHPGKVAGLFVGVAFIICLIAAALIWFFLRRKHQRSAEVETLASTAGVDTPQRRQSKMSTMGLLGGTKRSDKRRSVPMIQTSGWGPGNSTEKSPSDTPIDYRRTSYPRMVDQRLEPAALWNPLQDNGSHVSIQSFRDDQDYSRRMLRVSWTMLAEGGHVKSMVTKMACPLGCKPRRSST
ncbi:MAG: hypothetical protein Q9224_002682 [Gallowayella concinna]